ncbi:hypothetical protein XENOCAPTIV_020511, partial [Xenoophorus captivus]
AELASACPCSSSIYHLLIFFIMKEGAYAMQKPRSTPKVSLKYRLASSSARIFP